MIDKTIKFFDFLFFPQQTSEDVAIRLKSRILGGLLIFFLIVFGSLDFYTSYQNPNYSVPFLGYAIMLTALLFNRLGKYNTAAFLTAAMFPVVVFSTMLTATGREVIVTLNYLVLGLIFASILLGLRGTAILATVQIAGIFLLPWMNPAIFPSIKSILGTFTLNFLSASLLLYFMYLRNRIEKMRSHELVQSYNALKTTQENLRKQEILHERVLHTSPLFTYVYDLNDGRVVYHNRNTSEYLGYRNHSKDELSGQFLKTYLHPDDFVKLKKITDQWKSAHDTDLQREEFRIKDAAGQWRTFESTQAVFSRDEKGNVLQIITAARDVTDQKLLEERLHHAQKMETLGQLAGGVAHDFANMLTPIIGYSELLLVTRKPTDPDYSELNSILDAGIKAKYLIQQLLSFGRKQIMEIVDINLNELIKNFQKILRRTVRENVEIQYRLSTKIPSIRADSFQIEQIIMNMAINAQDAMPNGGILCIDVDRTVLDENYVQSNPEAAVGNYVCLSISDNGSGMDQATQKRIFEPFFTTKELGKGTGLGLATVYGIVKQHDGLINVYSEPGKGTTFRIYFPETEAAGTNLNTSAQQEVTLGQGRIVVVEDNEMAREMVCRILQSRGYETIDFDSPQSCLEYFQSNSDQVNLLLTDIIMPGMNGKELYHELRKMDEKLRVAYMSGYSENIISHHGILESGGILIPKPFSIELLMTKIQQALA
jgi:PAS domain S-box-containing protein